MATLNKPYPMVGFKLALFQSDLSSPPTLIVNIDPHTTDDQQFRNAYPPFRMSLQKLITYFTLPLCPACAFLRCPRPRPRSTDARPHGATAPRLVPGAAARRCGAPRGSPRSRSTRGWPARPRQTCRTYEMSTRDYFKPVLFFRGVFPPKVRIPH